MKYLFALVLLCLCSVVIATSTTQTTTPTPHVVVHNVFLVRPSTMHTTDVSVCDLLKAFEKRYCNTTRPFTQKTSELCQLVNELEAAVCNNETRDKLTISDMCKVLDLVNDEFCVSNDAEVCKLVKMLQEVFNCADFPQRCICQENHQHACEFLHLVDQLVCHAKSESEYVKIVCELVHLAEEQMSC